MKMYCAGCWKSGQVRTDIMQLNLEMCRSFILNYHCLVNTSGTGSWGQKPSPAPPNPGSIFKHGLQQEHLQSALLLALSFLPHPRGCDLLQLTWCLVPCYCCAGDEHLLPWDNSEIIFSSLTSWENFLVLATKHLCTLCYHRIRWGFL